MLRSPKLNPTGGRLVALLAYVLSSALSLSACVEQPYHRPYVYVYGTTTVTAPAAEPAPATTTTASPRAPTTHTANHPQSTATAAPPSPSSPPSYGSLPNLLISWIHHGSAPCGQSWMYSSMVDDLSTLAQNLAGSQPGWAQALDRVTESLVGTKTGNPPAARGLVLEVEVYQDGYGYVPCSPYFQYQLPDGQVGWCNYAGPQILAALVQHTGTDWQPLVALDSSGGAVWPG